MKAYHKHSENSCSLSNWGVSGRGYFSLIGIVNVCSICGQQGNTFQLPHELVIIAWTTLMKMTFYKYNKNNPFCIVGLSATFLYF